MPERASFRDRQGPRWIEKLDDEISEFGHRSETSKAQGKTTRVSLFSLAV